MTIRVHAESEFQSTAVHPTDAQCIQPLSKNIPLFNARKSKTQREREWENGRKDMAAQVFLVILKIMQKHSE